MTIIRKRPTFSFRFSENGNLLSVSFSRKNLAAGTAVMPFYTATRMLTTHQVLSFPQANKLSSSASLVKFSSSVCSMASFLWPHFLHFFFFVWPIPKNTGKRPEKWGHKNEVIVTPSLLLTCLSLPGPGPGEWLSFWRVTIKQFWFWPLLRYASWSQVCVTCVLWCDLDQEEWESNSVNRVELFDCHHDHVM